MTGAALLALAAAGRAQEAGLGDDDAKRLLNLHGCNACHAIDEARIGPPYRAVAFRYADAPAEHADWLAAKVITGGAGSWGLVPMVANPRLPAVDALALARWILALGRAEREAIAPVRGE